MESINSDSFRNALKILRLKGMLTGDATYVEYIPEVPQEYDPAAGDLGRPETALAQVSRNIERVLKIYSHAN